MDEGKEEKKLYVCLTMLPVAKLQLISTDNSLFFLPFETNCKFTRDLLIRYALDNVQTELC